jgi:hypothetical protein
VNPPDPDVMIELNTSEFAENDVISPSMKLVGELVEETRILWPAANAV